MTHDGDKTPRETWDNSTIGVDAGDLLPGASADRFYLLVFEDESSHMVPLPRSGEAIIGRAEGLEVRLADSSISRRHARISMTDGEATIVDLDSQNGTRVNGERISGARPLVSGDTITICTVTLTFQSNVRTQPTRAMVELAALRLRAEEEIERSLRFQRPLTLATIALGLGVADRPRVARAFVGHLRLIDVMAWSGADQVVVLLPETDAAMAPVAAARLAAALAGTAPTARVGVATCPADGCDVDTLMTSARAAAQSAEPSRVVAAARTVSRRTIGGRDVIVADPAMARLFSLIERLAASALPVLVCGETGTGKELAATALHEWSTRAGKPLVTLNCAALQETLIESELFGHEKGAFSGAVATKLGLLETAAGGTVFLDEIGELGATAQAKLLRVLETKRVTRLGDVKERDIDIRIVAATNRNLDEEVKKGSFRRDLFFRLSGAMVWLPPLRDRKRELPILAQLFLDDACARAHRAAMRISTGAMRTLALYDWPGNVRELKNVMEYAAAAVSESTLHASDVAERLRAGGAERVPIGGTPTLSGLKPLRDEPAPADGSTADDDAAAKATDRGVPRFRRIEDELRELEIARMTEALEAAGGNQTRAADLIDMPLRTFATKMKLYNLSRKPQRP